MEEKQFINREAEKNDILTSLNKEGPELIILYGRRRIGKSRLFKGY
jgi:AAA+ ATPase superfamily predicted ATPase